MRNRFDDALYQAIRTREFDERGHLRCEARFPEGFELYQAGDGFALGRFIEELGIEQVRRYTVAAPAGLSNAEAPF